LLSRFVTAFRLRRFARLGDAIGLSFSGRLGACYIFHGFGNRCGFSGLLGCFALVRAQRSLTCCQENQQE
jgi:hypothetical protein